MADDDHQKERDPVTGTETTGHEWDGIRELNNPMPLWWLYTFYATVVFAVIYCLLYPAVPMVRTATAGLLGYSSRGEVAQAIDAARAANADYLAALEAKDLAAIQGDPDLHRFALQGGASVFRTACSTCHGAGAAGAQAKGYPNLLDDAWIWGGSVEAIYQTVAHGIRAEDDDMTRFSAMPAFGDMGMLDDAQIATVVETVRSLGGLEHDEALAAEGIALYADNCASCHGEAGEGMQVLGAPTLNDAIWLYGSDRAALTATIEHGRAGMMPAWAGRLEEAQIKQVALYVHALGGGE